MTPWIVADGRSRQAADSAPVGIEDSPAKRHKHTVDMTGQFQSGPPAALFPIASMVLQGSVGRQFAVTKDGRFLVNVLQQQTSTVPLMVVVNWLAGVQK